MIHPSKTEVLLHYMVIDTLDDRGAWELQFHEGGRKETVFEYDSWQSSQSFWEEDALVHWSRVLKRTWRDDE